MEVGNYVGYAFNPEGTAQLIAALSSTKNVCKTLRFSQKTLRDLDYESIFHVYIYGFFYKGIRGSYSVIVNSLYTSSAEM